MNVNLTSLKDKAYDVDPDLRFMALDDFQKYLNDSNVTKNTRHVEAFIPILYRLLEDEATEVQNQAVKSFAPIMHYVNEKILLDIIKHLYQKILAINMKENDGTANNKSKKFTTSIPNIALRLIFNNESYHFSENLSRQILDFLIPNLFENIITIDSIEILIDLFKVLGSNLANDEINDLLFKLIDVSYKNTGISSKRSIVAFDYLLTQLNAIDDSGSHTHYLDKLLDDINFCFENTDQSISDISHRFILLQVCLNNLRVLKSNNCLSESSFNKIFELIKQFLKFEQISVDLEDFDLDLITQENSIREDSLITLNNLINSSSFNSNVLDKKIDEIVAIIKIFIKYDLLNQNDDDNDSDEDDSMANDDFDNSDIEFSDDDDDDENNNIGDDDNDGSSSKLRIQSIHILKSLASNFEEFLPTIYQESIYDLIKLIDDHYLQVSNDAIMAIIVIVNLTKSTTNLSNTLTRPRATSDVSMITSDSPIILLNNKILPVLEQELFNKLLTEKNLSRFPIFLKLIESLIKSLSKDLSDGFINNLFQAFISFKLTSINNMEILNLYKVILENIEVDKISVEFFEYSISDLSTAINDKSTYHNFLMESFTTINLFIRKIKLAGVSKLANFIDESLYGSISNKVQNKEYSSDIRISAITSLTELVISIQIRSENLINLIEVFKESLNYEITANHIIESLIKILSSNSESGKFSKNYIINDESFINLLISKLESFVSSSDQALYLNSSILLNLIPKDKTSNDLNKLFINIVKSIRESNDFKTINLLLNISNDLVRLKKLQISNEFWSNFITDVVESKLQDNEELNHTNFEKLVSSMFQNSTSQEDFFNIANEKLNKSNFISARILAIITLGYQKNDFIESSEQELISYVNNMSDVTLDEEMIVKIIFDVHFQGCISLQQDTAITLENFYTILNNSGNDSISLATSRAIGLFILRDTLRYLPKLLNKYDEESHIINNNKQNLLLISIKQILKSETIFNEENFEKILLSIWNKSIQISNGKLKFQSENLSELKMLGEILTKIILLDFGKYYNLFLNELYDDLNKAYNDINEESNQEMNESKIYINIVIIKSLIGNLEILTNFNNDNYEILIRSLINYSKVINIDIKQAIIGTLLTGVHNRIPFFFKNLSDKILPIIFKELESKSYFKKTIPMGPYKYVIDEGLEIRKLSYELLYTIITIDRDEINKSVSKIEINYQEIFEIIIGKGLTDLENDIIVLSSINLTNLINKFGIDNLIINETYLLQFIEILNKQMNKKIRAKASTQEVENFEDGMKSVIKLSKVINSWLAENTLSPYHNNLEWIKYYSEMKSKQLPLYNTVDV